MLNFLFIWTLNYLTKLLFVWSWGWGFLLLDLLYWLWHQKLTYCLKDLCINYYSSNKLSLNLNFDIRMINLLFFDFFLNKKQSFKIFFKSRSVKVKSLDLDLDRDLDCDSNPSLGQGQDKIFGQVKHCWPIFPTKVHFRL